MALGTYALTSVDEAKNYIGERLEADGLWVYCSASDATAATARVSASSLVLVITGGTSAGTTTLSFCDSDKDTLLELVTAINATTGWVAGARYYSGASSTDLVITGSLSCLGVANELTLKIEQNYLIERLIDRATDFIERAFDRKLDSRSYTREAYDGNGRTRMLLRQYPVTAVTRLAIGRIDAFSIKNTTATNNAFVEVTPTYVKLTADGTTTSLAIASYSTINLLISAIEAVSGWDCTLSVTAYGTRKATEILQRPALGALSPTIAYVEISDEDIYDYHLEGGTNERDNYGSLYYSGGFDAGHQNVFVDYTAGYTTIPDALVMLCLELVKVKYSQSKHDAALKSESIGGVYSYTMGDWKQVSDDIIEAASIFKRVTI